MKRNDKEVKNIASDPTKFGGSTNFDQMIWDETSSIIDRSGMNNRELIEHFILFLRRVNLAKFLAHIEVFKETINTPGCIVECGVFKGVSFVTFAKLVETLCPGDTLKRIIGFDTFSGFPSLNEKDGGPDERRGKVKGGWDSKDFLPFLEQVLEVSQKDSMIPRFKRIELVKGDACKTIPGYVKRNPGLRISLLHLDMDIYEPTLVALEHLYPLVVPGGVVLLDEYAMDGFPGESKAFDDYFGAHRPVVKKFSYISTPGGYFIKKS